MNANYIGSFAEQNMIFRSAVDVIETVSNEPFNSISVYVPSNLAPSVIKQYAQVAPMLTNTKPLVFSCDVQNYKDVMQGGLLTQLQPIYRNDSNVDLVIYVIVFYNEDDGVDYWSWSAQTVEHAPLSTAFEKLYFISYLKMMYDENMNGEATENVPSIGKLGKQVFTLTNNTVTVRRESNGTVLLTNTDSAEVTIAAGTYQGSWTDTASNKYVFNFTVPAPGRTIAPGGSLTLQTVSDSSSYLDPARGVIPAISTLDSVKEWTMVTTAAAPIAAWTWTNVTAVLANVSFQGQAAGIPQPIILNAGKYAIPDSVSGYAYVLTIAAPINIPNGGTSPNLLAVATVATDVASVGFPSDWTTISGLITTPNPNVNVAITATITGANFTPGELPGPATTVESNYFDLNLALAFLCKNNPSLSQHWLLVRVSLGDEGYFPNIPPVPDLLNPTALPSLVPTDPNKCKIRSASIAEEMVGIPSLLVDAETRTKFFWGALKLLQADETFLAAHSERPADPSISTPATNILSEVLAEWFRLRNASGQFIGNKVHNIRLLGDNIKPFGWPSPLNMAVNQNDTGYGFNEEQTMVNKSGVKNVLQPKNVAYLQTISDNSLENCRLTTARTLDGKSLNAKMISKWVDYHSAMDCANMITDRGTLTNPVLRDEEAYGRIQSIVFNNLSRFMATGRIVGIALTFPSFAQAKVGLTALEAASAWTATYIDDLDKVTVSGGIVEL